MPEVLGDFELLDELGRGGMGVVYRARQRSLDRIVAVKVLPAELAQQGQVAERFASEARRMARLTDRSIAQVYLVGEQDGLQYFAMQYLPGGSLEDCLRAGPIGVAAALGIAAQVAAALEVAHREGIIHRDIKPANIMFDERGQAVVTDFGIARAGDDVRLTLTGLAMGTPQYMAPEQARGNPTDHRADIYALGAVLYEMVCGRPPFDGDTPISVAMKHVNDPVPPPSWACPGLPGEVEAIILRAMAKEPADRFSSAADMGAALNSCLQHLNSPAPAPTVPGSPPIGTYPGGTRAIKRPRPANSQGLLIGGLVFALAGVAFLVIWGWIHRPPPPAQSQRDAGGRGPQEGPFVPGGGVGRASVAVPSVVGLAQSEAEAQLNSTGGFNIVYNDPAYSDVPPGNIVRQAPPGGTSQEPGDAVYLVMSLGPLPSEARGALNSAYQGWLGAWQSKNLSQFLSYYAEDVEVVRKGATTQDKSGLRARMESNFAKAGDISITSDDPTIQFDGDVAKLSAHQRYQSAIYWDVGTKHLTWRYANGQWQIVRESFDREAGS